MEQIATKKTKVTFSISIEDLKKLDEKAAERGISRADYLRDAVAVSLNPIKENDVPKKPEKAPFEEIQERWR